MVDGTVEDKDFGVVTVLIEAWAWALRNIFSLARFTWLSTFVFFLVMFLLLGAMVIAAYQFGFLEDLKAMADNSPQDFEAIMAWQREFMPALIALNVVLYVLFSFLTAVPVRVATDLAFGTKSRAFLYIFYFRLGRKEIRIALLTLFLLVLFYGPQLVVTFVFYDQIVAEMAEIMSAANGMPDIGAMMRVQSITGGIALFSMLIMAYIYGRLIPAVPIIVRGGAGLGIREAWRLTHGYGMVMFGLVLGSVIGMIVAILSMFLVLIPVILIFVAVGALVDNDVVFLLPVLLWLMMLLLWPGFLYGFFQRFQVTTYEWLSARKAEPA